MIPLRAILAVSLPVLAASAQQKPNGTEVRAQPFISVKEAPYFAVGDGSHDDTEAILGAVAAAEATNGNVQLPCGRYLFSKEITISKRITIQGGGDGAAESSARPCTTLIKTQDVVGIHITSDADYTSLSGFRLTSTASMGTADGIVVGDADRTNGAGEVTLRDIFIDHQRGNGIFVRNGNLGIMDHVTTNGNAANGNFISSQHTAVDNTNAWRLYSSTSIGNKLDGFRFDNAASTSGFGLASEGNGRYGIYANRPYIYLQGYTEGNKMSNVYLDTKCFDCFTIVRDVENTTRGNGASFMFNMAGSGITPKLDPRTGRFDVRSLSTAVVTPSYRPSIEIDNDLGNSFIITATDQHTFSIAAPLDRNYPQRISITIRNVSGGNLGAITWNAAYLMSPWESPAAGFSRTIDFQLSVKAGKWTEVSRTPKDVPN